jgi:hypothetical protein
MTFDPAYYTGSTQDSFGTRQPLSKAEEDFNKLPAEKVRDVVELAMLSEQTRAAAIHFHNVDVPLFVKKYPAYINNDHNMKLMQLYWQEVFGVEIPTLPQMEEAYCALRTRGVLQLNKAVVAKEDAAEVAQKLDKMIAERKAAEFNEEAAYNMPFEELERRARGF